MPDDSAELLKGTLDLLILRTLAAGPLHGHAIVHSIHESSREALLVDHGSLYPALHRLERKGLVTAAWGVSDHNRRARFYKLSPAGRKQLAREKSAWRKLATAIDLVLGGRESEA